MLSKLYESTEIDNRAWLPLYMYHARLFSWHLSPGHWDVRWKRRSYQDFLLPTTAFRLFVVTHVRTHVFTNKPVCRFQVEPLKRGRKVRKHKLIGLTFFTNS